MSTQQVLSENEDEFHDAENQFQEVIEENVTSKINTGEDDQTEDQVPEISGTENVLDPMTISVDEIEEISVIEDDTVQNEDVENSIADVPDQLENDEAIEKKTDTNDQDKKETNEVIEVSIMQTNEMPVEQKPENDQETRNLVIETEETDVSNNSEVLENNKIEKTNENDESNNKINNNDDKENFSEVITLNQPDIENVEQNNDLEKSNVKESDVKTESRRQSLANAQLSTPKRGSIVENNVDDIAETELNNSRRASKVSVADDKNIRRESNASVKKIDIDLSNLNNTRRESKASIADDKNIRRESNASVKKIDDNLDDTRRASNGQEELKEIETTIAQSPKEEINNSSSNKTTEIKTQFVFNEASPVASPKSPKKIEFDDETLSTSTTTKSKSRSKSPSKSPPKAIRKKSKLTKPKSTTEPESQIEEDSNEIKEEKQSTNENLPSEELANDLVQEPGSEESMKQDISEKLEAPEEQEQEKIEDTEEGALSSPRRARVQSPSPPPRVSRKETYNQDETSKNYASYDQDSHRQTVPSRLPTATSFSSWVKPESKTYEPISPWVNKAGKYRNEYTTGVPQHTASYTSFFDDLVSTGPFSNNLYSTSRLLERSRSRTRERRNAMRSQRAASNYYRFASQLPAPLRTRDYSTPPTSAVYKPVSRPSSFITFMDYANSKQYDLSRNPYRSSLYDSNQALSRSSSRGNIDYYLGSGRISRVDSYVNNLNSRYEWQVPSNYDVYRSASRSHVGYTPLNQYSSFTNPLYTESPQRLRNTINEGTVRNLFENRIDDLQRSLSRERYERDRLRSNYTRVAYQLEQAVKQMDLLRSNGYSSLRSGSQPRTSVYSHYYPYH